MEKVETNGFEPKVGQGTAGLNTQAGNQPATVSGAAEATGGVAPGNFIETDIDDELFKFSSDDTPLMNLMLKAKKVTVNSPEVQHFMIDEPVAVITTSGASTAGKLLFTAADAVKVHAYDTLCVKSKKNAEGRPVQLFVTSVDETTGEVSVLCDNFGKSSSTDEYGTLKAGDIASGVDVTILGNALYETQKEVDPDLVLPQPELVYLQKRGMNNIVSDYFDSQKKRIPFTQATIAEAAIRNFKVKGNRSLWISQKSKMRVKAKKTGDMQYVYKMEGVRWQFKREVEHTGKWTYEQFVSLAKMFYTGEDVPTTALGLCGKNFLERLQTIDWSGHPEIKIEQKTTKLGWTVMNIHTAFGDLPFKHEPTLDRIGYSNSCALLGEDRLVHYQRKAESSFNDRVEGEEASRSGVLVWDALALKGSCHIWIDGEGAGEKAPGATEFKFWGGSAMPTASEAVNGVVYVLEKDIDATHVAMSAWKATVAGSSVSYTRYTDMVYGK